MPTRSRPSSRPASPTGRWLLGATVLLGGLGCGDTEPPFAAEGGVVLATVTVEPPYAGPGATVEVTVQLPGVAAPSVVLALDGVANPLALQGGAGGWSGRVALELGAGLGDRRLEVVGTSAEAPIAGFALVHVTARTCGPGEVPVGPGCGPPSAGHALHLDWMMPWHEFEPHRAAVRRDVAEGHPRAVAAWDDQLVGCYTENVAVTPMSALMRGDEIGQRWTGKPVAAGTELATAGLARCQDLVLDATRLLAVTASRGDGHGSGGLASWRVTPGAPPELADARFDDVGIESVALQGDRVYATAKPRALEVVRVMDDGALTPLQRTELPGVGAVWDVAVADARVYVTDAGAKPVGGGYQSGQLLVLELDANHAAQVLGSVATSGAASGVAILADDVVAVASGQAGVELFDVRDPAQPVRLAGAQTPSPTVALDHHDGLLVSASWHDVRLYDTADRGVLRLLDVADAVEGGFPPPDIAPWFRPELVAAFHVRLHERTVLVADIDSILMGGITEHASAPRLLVPTQRIAVRRSSSERAVFIPVANGGREPAWVEAVGSDRVTPQGPRVIVGPGDEAGVEVVVIDLLETTEVFLRTNDPARPLQSVAIVPVEGYEPGDTLPAVQLPQVGRCNGAPCAPCADLGAESIQGRPYVLAFFASW